MGDSGLLGGFEWLGGFGWVGVGGKAGDRLADCMTGTRHGYLGVWVPGCLDVWACGWIGCWVVEWMGALICDIWETATRTVQH